MVLTSYAKQRILFHFNNGHRAPAIAKLCQQEEIVTNRVTVWRFLCFYEKTGCIMRKEGSGRPSKITSEIKVIVERQMEDDDETTASQLYKLLKERGTRVSITHAAIRTYTVYLLAIATAVIICRPRTSLADLFDPRG